MNGVCICVMSSGFRIMCVQYEPVVVDGMMYKFVYIILYE